jgi:hypothetical protein
MTSVDHCYYGAHGTRAVADSIHSSDGLYDINTVATTTNNSDGLYDISGPLLL